MRNNGQEYGKYKKNETKTHGNAAVEASRTGTRCTAAAFICVDDSWEVSFESVWQLFVMAIIGTVALILTTKAYQLLDPTICVVLASQEVLLDFSSFLAS